MLIKYHTRAVTHIFKHNWWDSVADHQVLWHSINVFDRFSWKQIAVSSLIIQYINADLIIVKGSVKQSRFLLIQCANQLSNSVHYYAFAGTCYLGAFPSPYFSLNSLFVSSFVVEHFCKIYLLYFVLHTGLKQGDGLFRPIFSLFVLTLPQSGFLFLPVYLSGDRRPYQWMSAWSWWVFSGRSERNLFNTALLFPVNIRPVMPFLEKYIEITLMEWLLLSSWYYALRARVYWSQCQPEE